MRWKIVLAEKTSAARDWKRNHYAIAFVQILDGTAFFFDYAHELVAEDKIFQLRKEAVVNVEIGSADGSRGDAENNVPRLLNFRIVDVIDFDAARSVKNERFHLSKRKAGL